MPARHVSLTLDARDPVRLAAFWRHLLGRQVVDAAGAILLPGSGGQLGLRFVAGAAPRVGPNRMHLHLTSTSLAGQADMVEAALALGARHLDVGQLPEEGHAVLADPEGNELCVIRPGSDFLAGCGLLGEVACEGTRRVGLFWQQALAWPLVWEHGEETAVQSPHGGTKLAWGGPPVAPQLGRNGQRLDVTVADEDLAADVARLVALGATRLGGAEDGGVALTDPDGNEFCLRPG